MLGLMYILKNQKASDAIILSIFLLTIYYTIITTNI